MKQVELNKMSCLFEKMVANNANTKEQCELTKLYEAFIDEDRELKKKVSTNNMFKSLLN